MSDAGAISLLILNVFRTSGPVVHWLSMKIPYAAKQCRRTGDCCLVMKCHDVPSSPVTKVTVIIY
jgi:hypothetical protein